MSTQLTININIIYLHYHRDSNKVYVNQLNLLRSKRMSTLPKVEMKAEGMEPDKPYIWALPSGEKKVVWLSKDKIGIDEWDDTWYFDDSLVGNLYGPFDLELKD